MLPQFYQTHLQQHLTQTPGGVTKIAKTLTESGLQPSSPVDKSSVYLGLKSLTVQQERRSCPGM